MHHLLSCVPSLGFRPLASFLGAASLIAISFFPSAARADEPASEPQRTADVPPSKSDDDEADNELRRVYLSISPVHLLFPVVEVTGEVRVHPKIGVAAIAGYGQITSEGIEFPLWEAGGQFVGYPLGTFDNGMQLGAEVLYAGLSGDTSSGNTKISLGGEGLSTGAFVGYKLATKVGFSFNVQGGVSYIVARANGSSSTGATAQAEKSQWAPLLNLNVGWSF